MHQDRSPWGPAAIAVVFVVIGVSAAVRSPDAPAVWIIVVLAALVAGWYGRTAVLRLLETDDDER